MASFVPPVVVDHIGYDLSDFGNVLFGASGDPGDMRLTRITDSSRRDDGGCDDCFHSDEFEKLF